jgi:hypothetical protein
MQNFTSGNKISHPGWNLGSFQKPTSENKIYLLVVLEARQLPARLCQMAYFQTKNPDLGKFLWVLQWKMLVYMVSRYLVERQLVERQLVERQLVEFKKPTSRGMPPRGTL